MLVELSKDAPVLLGSIRKSPELDEPKKKALEEEAAELTVAAIAGRKELVVCTERSSLARVAEALLERGRTCAVVAGDDGRMAGALTETDILHAIVIGLPGSYTVGEWLQSGCARAPCLEEAPAVAPSATIPEAARAMLPAGGDRPSRHAVLRDRRGKYHGVVTSLDLAAAATRVPPTSEVAERMRSLAVSDAMQPLSALPTCSSDATLQQAWQKMLLFQQGCVVITFGASSCVQGVLTTRDVLRAFVDRAKLSTRCGAWLRQSGVAHGRFVDSEVLLDAAVSRAVAQGLHHIVVATKRTEVLGVVSASDVTRMLGASK